MSLSAEHVEEIKTELAIVCCRIEAGNVIGAENLEDPAIFDDLQDSGLLKVPADCLRIEQVIGAKLTKTIDSLTPLTPDILEGIKEASVKKVEIKVDENAKAVLKYNKKSGDVVEAQDFENPMHFEKMIDSNLFKIDDEVLTIKDVIGKKLNKDVVALTPVVGEMIEGFVPKKADKPTNYVRSATNSGVMRIKIDEGKGIDIQIPLNVIAQGGFEQEVECGDVAYNQVAATEVKEVQNGSFVQEPKEIRKLLKKHHKITEVKFGKETKIEGSTLYIRKSICKDAVKGSELVKDIKIEIITPNEYNKYSETIMDVQPIATKEKDCQVGSGVTRMLDGVIMMVTGIDEDGVQIGEFGSSEGILEENIMWGRPGAPDNGDIFIKTQVTIVAGTNMERPGPYAAHKVSDIITQEIRDFMKEADDSLFESNEEVIQYRRPGKKKVVIVKEIMGQGAMHDNLILPVEPVGVLGGKPNVDLGNVPVMLSPLEVLDGGIHALTCIGPASKECSRHYFREPLVIEAMNDENIDLCGVIFVGSPQINAEKFYVSERLGMMVEALDVDGAVVTTEGFGNNHIDFASHIEQIGMRGVEVVGMSFCGVQGALVVGNKYMKHMVDNNKSEEGIENEVLGCNTLCKEDALRALSMLKSALDGDEVKAPERKWNANVKESNLDLIGNSLNDKIDRVANETSIPLSEKRKKKMGGNQ
ncbi:D-proline reductase (dithiol) proprotein PrdA [Sedimentibacter sp. zth1]|uniref:D-proline reductase (dithiol) proprotein PrdA n=1 Tax=Sedimentibacter sp. zth1 TaxID=2816908 RepID=UPI001A93A37A|nr:D-proline reductase (dithiol) proprotein PrdA [Sedimentibacter sp. zth1]QSX05955.1 D-proline reductase (dithiol) proprotein PrdA [Sedimentibacter sp. zth1]